MCYGMCIHLCDLCVGALPVEKLMDMYNLEPIVPEVVAMETGDADVFQTSRCWRKLV